MTSSDIAAGVAVKRTPPRLRLGWDSPTITGTPSGHAEPTQATTRQRVYDTYMPDTDRLVMAARLREAREDIGLTQFEVAATLGVPRSGVADFERGLRNVTALEMRRLARLYRRDIAWLVGEVVDSPIDTELERAMARLADRDRRSVIQFARFLASQPTPLLAMAHNNGGSS